MRFYHRKHGEKKMSKRNAKEKNKRHMQCQV